MIDPAPPDADYRERLVWAPPESVYAVLRQIGRSEGYYTDRVLWRLRSALGAILSGEPRGESSLHEPHRLGDRFDYWRVAAMEPNRLFRISSAMRGLGEASITWRVDPRPAGRCLLTQTATLLSRTLAGRAYWSISRPPHAAVFARLLRGIAIRAESGSLAPPPPVRPTKRLRIVRREITVPSGLDETFAFFADAGNLEAITPPWLRFHIVSPRPIAMAEGTLIDYRLRIHGLPIGWNTRIDAWQPPHRFVDRQLRGPYRWWHHEHRFEAAVSGTRVVDEVEYAAPLPWISEPLVVRRDVERIFDYRTERLRSMLGASVAPPTPPATSIPV